ncbi:ParA family protein [Deinococcus frigens]|uniref:ParA family protein n=1 Tax=Deinococcus frigens TaxID=249403 RepID=UPI000A04A5CF|nr:ParA family protein [Deinococcus frigens]
MKMIAVLSKKGGVGKTLLSMGLAQTLAAHGKHAVVIDHDPEGSAIGWRFNAEENGRELPYQVLAPVDVVAAAAAEYVVVDTPPNDLGTLQQVATRADYIVIPVLPGSGEVDRLQETMRAIAAVQEKLKAGVHIGFVLNRMEHNNLAAAMPEVMENLNYPVIAQIGRSVDYQRAFGGLVPQHLTTPFTQILEELEIL